MGTRTTMLRAALLLAAVAATPAMAPKAQNKAALRMGLEDITDTSSFGFLKGIAFFGASFVPSFFLAGYFLGGYYPGLAAGAPTEPEWCPTAMQYAHGVPKGTLNANVAKVEAKEAELKAVKEKAAAAKKAAKKAAAEAKKAAEAKAAAQ